MHLCLQISEILTNIFESYDDSDESKSTLLHLALVCKVFLEPALDALWKFQRSFLPLVKTFPEGLWEDLWEEKLTEKPTKLIFWTRRLIPSDWSRFQIYARYMKSLDWSPAYLQTTPSLRFNFSVVFRAIDRSLQLGHCQLLLLPNISDLTIKQNAISLLDAHIFLGPRLRRLTLAYLTSAIGTPSFLRDVKSRCPSLEVLCIWHYDNSTPIISMEISDLVCNLPRLQQALLDVALNHKALVHLASLPNLWRLHVSFSYESVAQGYREPFPSLSFAALKELNAKFASIADAGDFLQTIPTSSKLESLKIGVTTTPSPQELHTFFTMVHQSCSRYTLTTVSLYYHNIAMGHPFPPSLEAYAFLSLFQCPNIEDISLGMPYTQQAIDNALMQDIALAWSRLRRIDILSLESDSHSSVNLEGVLHLGQHCHRLEAVKHQFDVSLPANPTNAEENRIRNETMTCLDVGYSRVTDPYAVAAFLFDVFPNLRLHYGWHFGEDESSDEEDEEDQESIAMHKCWKEVDTRLTELAAIRNQEKS